MDSFWAGWIHFGLDGFILGWMDSFWAGWIHFGLDGFILGWMDSFWAGWIHFGLDGFILGWMDSFWAGWIHFGLDGFILGWMDSFWAGWIHFGLDGFILGWMDSFWAGWIHFDQKCFYKFDGETDRRYQGSLEDANSRCSTLYTGASALSSVDEYTEAWLESHYLFWRTNPDDGGVKYRYPKIGGYCSCLDTSTMEKENFCECLQTSPRMSPSCLILV